MDIFSPVLGFTFDPKKISILERIHFKPDQKQALFLAKQRTSRLMMNGELLRNGLPVLNVFAQDQLEFNKQMINFYDTQDATDALIFFIDYYMKQNTNLGFDE